MNSFKLVFKASKFLKQKEFLLKAENLFTNLSKKNYTIKPLTIIKSPIKIHKFDKSRQYFFLNHQKYLSLSLIKLNETSSTVNQTSNENNNKQEKKQNNGFMRLFEKENLWKVSFVTMIMLCGSIMGWVIFTWGAPQYDENGILIKDEFTDLNPVIQYIKRAFYATLNYYQMFKDPTSDKLLPEPLKEPYYQPPYTLVIELTGVLAHPEWNIKTGWRYKKRPGLEFFLEQIKYPLFEVVLFTNEPFMSIVPVVEAMDPNQLIQYKLFRESTKFENGVHIKDLSYLNRDLKRVILIDWDEKAYKLQPRNALHRLKKFKGDDDDTDLVYLASFLKTIATSGVDDVRTILDYYNGEIDPLDTFKMNQVKLHEAEAKRQKELEDLKKKQTSSPFSWARKYTGGR